MTKIDEEDDVKEEGKDTRAGGCWQGGKRAEKARTGGCWHGGRKAKNTRTRGSGVTGKSESHDLEEAGLVGRQRIQE